MNRDPFFQEIVDRLPLVSDGNLFETCAASLLSKEWPNLLPVPGGQDSGLDGAFVDDAGHGLLVATIREDVIGNVTKNLKQHLADGGNRRRVLVATTQALTPRRCQNIEKRIRELGFQVAHYPYTKEALAERLYRDSRWCRDLLGISGDPPSLSRIPAGVRPFRDLPLLQREDDLNWLENTAGDKVVVGHPGIGKTYLLHSLVNARKGLFVIDNDLGRVTTAIRDQRPSALFIEDAHLRVELVTSLKRYRVETGQVYDIVADCWPAAKQKVCEALSVGESKCRELEPFPPAKIVELINSAGIGGPPALLHQLVNQSGGYPGRAAMLCHVCTTQDIGEAWDGRALARWVHVTFEKLVNERSLQILAAFAVGGNAGVQVSAVASILEYPVGEIRESIAKLAFGGVVYDLGNDTFSVVPTPLRCVLVKNYFFDGPAPLPLNRFLERISSLDSVFSALLGARSRGASVPQYILLEMFRNSRGSRAWEEFVWADTSHAEIVVDRFPERTSTLAPCLLAQAPDRMIPRLLDESAGDDRPLHSTPSQPLRVLKDWVESAPPASGESVVRRLQVWSHIKNRISKTPSDTASLQSITFVLSPHFEDRYLDPGNPNAFTIRSGIVALDELQQIVNLWPEIVANLKQIEVTDWTPMFKAIDQWVYWRNSSVPMSDEHRSLRDKTAEQMLKDLGKLCGTRRGAQREILERATALGISIDAQIDEVFTTLFPFEDRETDWQQQEIQQRKVADELVVSWIGKQPSEWTKQLTDCLKEARSSGHIYPNQSIYLCNQIAAKTNDVLGCLDALMTNGGESSHLLPFAWRAANDCIDGWEDRFRTFLKRDDWRDIPVSVLLPKESVEESLLAETIQAAKSYPKTVQIQSLRKELHDARILSLFAVDDPGIREALAVGLWQAEPVGTIAQSYIAEWRAAVIAHVHQEYHLKQMIDAHSELAFSWLRDRAVNSRRDFFDDLYEIAANKLSENQRIEIIDVVTADAYHARPLLKAVVGDSPNHYEHLLTKVLPAWAHLAPLTGVPNKQWCELARFALNVGYAPEDLVAFAFSDSPASFGPISSRYERQLQVWEKLSSDDTRVTAVLNLGKTTARSDLERWSAQEKQEEFSRVYG